MDMDENNKSQNQKAPDRQEILADYSEFRIPNSELADEVRTSFTPEQTAAVRHRGGALLVSAAAGSGKTKVLVERLLDRVEDGDDIDEFLVIT